LRPVRKSVRHGRCLPGLRKLLRLVISFTQGRPKSGAPSLGVSENGIDTFRG
jgi:hypothetical protein